MFPRAPVSATRADPRTGGDEPEPVPDVIGQSKLIQGNLRSGQVTGPRLGGQHLLGVAGDAQVRDQLAELAPDDPGRIPADSADKADQPFGSTRSRRRRRRSCPWRRARCSRWGSAHLPAVALLVQATGVGHGPRRRGRAAVVRRPRRSIWRSGRTVTPGARMSIRNAVRLWCRGPGAVRTMIPRCRPDGRRDLPHLLPGDLPIGRPPPPSPAPPGSGSRPDPSPRRARRTADRDCWPP